MNIRTTRLALILGIAGALVLGACKRATPTQPAATSTSDQVSATVTVTPRPTHLPVRTWTPRPTLPGTTYPGPSQAAPLATQVPAPTSALETNPTEIPIPTASVPTQAAYPAPGAGAPTQPGAYPGPGSNYTPPTPFSDAYPGPGVQPTSAQPTATPLPATQPPATQPPPTQLPPQSPATPTPYLGTSSPTKVPVTATPNPVFSTFTPTPTFPSSFGDSQFHVTDPATVKLASGDYQLVEFFAYWCGTCRAMAPLMNSLEDQYKGQIQFTFLDIDNPATRPFKDALHFGVEPEYYLLDGQGKVIKQWSGYVSKDEFQAVFDAVIK